jgi:hypothetical protein
MTGAIPPLPQYAFMAWCLVKHRDNLPLPLPLHDILFLKHKRMIEIFIIIFFLLVASRELVFCQQEHDLR